MYLLKADYLKKLTVLVVRLRHPDHQSLVWPTEYFRLGLGEFANGIITG